MLQSDWVGEKRAAGYVMGLIGANGADKTTAIRCLLGMRGFEAGEIELPGRRVPGPRSRCASNLMALLTLSWALFASTSLSSRAVSVGAVGDGGDDDRDLLVFDQVQHPVFAPARRVLRRERLKERLADPVRVLRQRAVDELPARSGDLLGHPLQRPHCRWAQHDPVAHRARFPRAAMRASSVAMQTGSGRPRACMSATTSASSPISTPCARAAMIFSISAAVM